MINVNRTHFYHIWKLRESVFLPVLIKCVRVFSWQCLILGSVGNISLAVGMVHFLGVAIWCLWEGVRRFTCDTNFFSSILIKRFSFLKNNHIMHNPLEITGQKWINFSTKYQKQTFFVNSSAHPLPPTHKYQMAAPLSNDCMESSACRPVCDPVCDDVPGWCTMGDNVWTVCKCM